MLSRMQFTIQYEEALELPAGEIVKIFEKLVFIRISEVIDGSPVLLFHGTFLKGKSPDDLNQVPSVELRDILYREGNQILFSACMSGPIAKLIVSQKDAWPIAPIIIEKQQLILSMEGVSSGLSRFLTNVKGLLGSLNHESQTSCWRIAALAKRKIAPASVRIMMTPLRS